MFPLMQPRKSKFVRVGYVWQLLYVVYMYIYGIVGIVVELHRWERIGYKTIAAS